MKLQLRLYVNTSLFCHCQLNCSNPHAETTSFHKNYKACVKAKSEVQ